MNPVAWDWGKEIGKHLMIAGLVLYLLMGVLRPYLKNIEKARTEAKQAEITASQAEGDVPNFVSYEAKLEAAPGAKAPPAAKAAPSAPKEVQAPPKAATKPASQKINFLADALFDFDQSELRPQGKAMLDDLANTLGGAAYEVILAIGHTDRLGSAQYNQKLSLKRAESVKQYLVAKGVAPNRIYAEGKGKAQPITKPADCRMTNRKALITCLQADRRVDVEVTASK
jgi:OOP family OmpA-OmpF porin